MIVTAKQITADDRARLNSYASNIVQKGAFNADIFAAEVRRAMCGRQLGA